MNRKNGGDLTHGILANSNNIHPKSAEESFFYSVLQTGRIFGNTLPFVAALACLGMYVNKKYHTTAVELFALGSLIHIALDQV